MRKYLIFILAIFVMGCASVPTRRATVRYSPSSSFIEVGEFCQKYGMNHGFDTLDDVVRISSSEKEMRLLLNSRVGYLNGGIFYLKNPLFILKERYLFPVRLKELLLGV